MCLVFKENKAVIFLLTELMSSSLPVTTKYSFSTLRFATAAQEQMRKKSREKPEALGERFWQWLKKLFIALWVS